MWKPLDPELRSFIILCRGAMSQKSLLLCNLIISRGFKHQDTIEFVYLGLTTFSVIHELVHTNSNHVFYNKLLYYLAS